MKDRPFNMLKTDFPKVLIKYLPKMTIIVGLLKVAKILLLSGQIYIAFLTTQKNENLGMLPRTRIIRKTILSEPSACSRGQTFNPKFLEPPCSLLPCTPSSLIEAPGFNLIPQLIISTFIFPIYCRIYIQVEVT